MAKYYDSAELRRHAASLQEASADISAAVKQTLGWIKEDIPGNLAGDTAEALEETASDMEKAISRSGRDLDEIGSLLKAYAAMLDNADKQAAEMIQAK